jgi:hypothetical protein
MFGYYEQGRLISAGRTRIGFTPALRGQLFKRLRDLEINVCTFANLPENSWSLGTRTAGPTRTVTSGLARRPGTDSEAARNVQ